MPNNEQIAETVRRRVSETITAMRAGGAANAPKRHCFGWRVKGDARSKQNYLLTDFEGYEATEDYWYPVAAQVADRLAQSPVLAEMRSAFTASEANSERFQGVLLNILTREAIRQLDHAAGPVETVESDLLAARNDLRGVPNSVFAELHLWGVSVLTEPIRFRFEDVDCVLRRITADELAVPSTFVDAPTTIHYATTTLELHEPNSHLMSHQLRVPRLLALLRLFGVGGVRVVREFVRTSSLIDFCAFGRWSQFGAPPQLASHHSYEIDEQGAKQLGRFAAELAPQLALRATEFGRPPTSPWQIAYARYERATATSVHTAEQTTLAVMCLEAILSERANSWRLATRAAGLLSCIGEESGEVQKVVRAGYRTRNDYVHGDIEVEPDGNDEAGKDRVRKLLQYCRKALVITLAYQFVNKQTKPQLLKLVDEHLLSRHSTTELSERIGNLASLL